MPNYTENYNLKKPLPNENYNIEDFNDNADIIDQKIKDIENSVENIEVPVTSVNGQTGDIELTAGDVGAETPAGAQQKADQAEQNAKAYTDQQIANIDVPVTSVNGKTGDVVLNAEDVGAPTIHQHNQLSQDVSDLDDTVSARLAESATNFTNININIVDMAVELETIKDATLNGVTANIFVETFQNLDDINLLNGIYDSTNKRLVL